MEQLGEGVSQAANFYDNAASDNAFNNYQSQAVKLLYGDPDKAGPDGQPDTGFMGLSGAAAMSARPQVESQLDQLQQETRNSLSNPAQQLQFDEYSRRYRASAAMDIGSHTDQQAKVWYSQVSDGTIQNGAAQITLNPTDNTNYLNGASDIINGYTRKAEQLGAQKGDPVWNSYYQQGRQVAFKTRLGAIGATDPLAARQMLDAHPDLAGTDYAALEQDFRTRSTQQAGQDWHSNYIKTNTPATAAAYATSPANPTNPVYSEVTTEIPGGFTAGGIARLIQGESPNGQDNANGHMGYAQASSAAWAAYGAGGDPHNLADAAAFAQRYAVANSRYLTPILDRTPTDAELALAHNQGPTGAARLLGNPNASAASLVGLPAVIDNGGTADMTAQQFVAMRTNKFNGTTPAGSARPQQPTPIGGLSQANLRANYMTVAQFGDPRTPGWAAQNLTQIASPDGLPVTVNKLAATAFSGFLRDLKTEGYDPRTVEGYNVRPIRGDAAGLSQHAFGNAIDINPDANPMGASGRSDLPANIGQLAAKWGLKWGGSFIGRKDPMHFEWTGAGAPSVGPNAMAAAGVSPSGGPAGLESTPANGMPSSLADVGQAPSVPQGTAPDAAAELSPQVGTGAAPPPSVAGIASTATTPAVTVAAGVPVSPRPSLADEFQAIADSNLNPQEKDAARKAAIDDQRAQAIADDTTATQVKQQNDASLNKYFSAIMQGQIPPLAQVANDNTLNAEGKKAVSDFMVSHADMSVSGASQAYGPGYWKAYQQILADPGDPSRISDPVDVLKMGAAGGPLTGLGVQKLLGVMNDIKKPDQAAIEDTKKSLIAYAKSKLSFQQDPSMMAAGVPPLKDPQGEQLFNAQFIPQFEAAYSQAQAKGLPMLGKNGFLSQENVDAIAGQLRNPREMALSKLEAQSGVNAAAPILAAPTGADPTAWQDVLSIPALSKAGNPWPQQNWAMAVHRLWENPDAATQQAFDAHFSNPEFNAAQLLDILRPNGVTDDQERATRQMDAGEMKQQDLGPIVAQQEAAAQVEAAARNNPNAAAGHVR